MSERNGNASKSTLIPLYPFLRGQVRQAARTSHGKLVSCLPPQLAQPLRISETGPMLHLWLSEAPVWLPNRTRSTDV